MTDTGSLNAAGVVVITPQVPPTDDYEAASLLISADRPVAGMSFADSDGSCSAPFLPTNLMKRRYIVPTSVDYVAFASKQAGTIQIFDETQALVATLTLARTGAATNAPYKAYTTTGEVGYTYVSTVPMAAWYQPNNNTNAGNDDETIMYGTD